MHISSEPAKSRDQEGNQLHVLVVDDSAMVRQVMQGILTIDRRIRVTVAADPLIAFTKMKKDAPDVIITDLEMPHMDGLSFVRKIMAESPIPVVICSGLAAKGTELALRALDEGAVEVINKPKLGVREFLHESAVLLLDTVWSAAEARLRTTPGVAAPAPLVKADPAPAPSPKSNYPPRSCHMIAIGASTGGTDALRTVLTEMPVNCPPIVVVQHMPEVFTRAFAERLNTECAIRVKEAKDGDILRNGEALIGPGNFHAAVEKSASGYQIKLSQGALVSRHRPSVDVLFRSVAAAAGSNAVGIIMTGMGDDGAQGLSEMKARGAATIAQDEASCVVFGMPREAISRGAADWVLPLEQIASLALELALVDDFMQPARPD
jgi:two-component system, chemotaxis family, protein-glutamate methylesterase/glutaminase